MMVLLFQVRMKRSENSGLSILNDAVQSELKWESNSGLHAFTISGYLME